MKFDVIKNHLASFLIPVFVLAMWAGFVAVMDQRHETKGANVQMQIDYLKREKRVLENYEELAPNSEYSAARRAEIRALTDDIESLKSKLD